MTPLLRVVVAIPFILAFCGPGQRAASAYVMPAEQLVDRMTKNFSHIETLRLTEWVHWVNPGDGSLLRVFEQKLGFKSPDLIHREALPVTEGQDAQPGLRPEEIGVFRRLLLANEGESILSLLADLGLDINCVAFTRTVGKVAYRIGDRAWDSPKLLIEKARLIPLMLAYRAPTGSGARMITIRFDDYRKNAGGWYPYEITLAVGEIAEYRRFVLECQVNVPLGDVVFSRLTAAHAPPPKVMTEEEPPSPADEPLKEIIELFKKKYR